MGSERTHSFLSVPPEVPMSAGGPDENLFGGLEAHPLEKTTPQRTFRQTLLAAVGLLLMGLGGVGGGGRAVAGGLNGRRLFLFPLGVCAAGYAVFTWSRPRSRRRPPPTESRQSEL
jgi:hypothetical protein